MMPRACVVSKLAWLFWDLHQGLGTSERGQGRCWEGYGGLAGGFDEWDGVMASVLGDSLPEAGLPGRWYARLCKCLKRSYEFAFLVCKLLNRRTYL